MCTLLWGILHFVHDVTSFVAVHSSMSRYYSITVSVTVYSLDVARNLLCRTTLSWRHIIGMRDKKKTHQYKQRKQSDCLLFIHSYSVSWIHGHIFISMDIASIFPATVRSTFKKSEYTVTLNEWTVNSRFVYVAYIDVFFFYPAFQWYDVMTK
jgi:hypothetical protein